MNLLKKIFRLAFFTLLLGLLLGLANLKQPVPLAFFLVMIAMRALELRHAAPEGLIHWYRAEQHPRWIVWLSGAGFITNTALPILDYRYRGEVFWSSPFDRAPLWLAALGLALLLAGSLWRLKTIVVQEAPKPVTKALDGKRKTKSRVAEAEPEPASPRFHLEPAFYHATALSYFGIAVCFTSLLGALAIFAVILPPLFHGKKAQPVAS
jgi:hypothetical protein